jgi:2-C-methyl-D-erythritol 4-phosphate cytidylyltransferase
LNAPPLQNFVAILAAGKGSRMGLSQPKQFEMLNGKTILEHSVDTFEKHPNIDGIFIVVHKDFRDKTKHLLENREKIVQIVEGGTERTDSSYRAILAVDDFLNRYEVRGTGCGVYDVAKLPRTSHLVPRTINLLIHDAARPFVSEDIITRTIQALNTHNVVSVATPAIDTIYICNEDMRIQSSPNRNLVYLAQTPQAARLSIFKQAFELARQNPNHIATDDANVILQYLPDEKIHIVLGDLINKKITYREDLTPQ